MEDNIVYKGFTIYGDVICSLADLNGMLSGVYSGIDTIKYLIDKTEGQNIDMFKLTEQLQQYVNSNTEEKIITIDTINTIING
jgi:hypothetical protein